jgi:hypothetical protein
VSLQIVKGSRPETGVLGRLDGCPLSTSRSSWLP